VFGKYFCPGPPACHNVFILLKFDQYVTSIMQIYAVSITIRIVVSNFATPGLIFYLTCHFG